MVHENFTEDILFSFNHCPDDFFHDYERYLYNEPQLLKLQTSKTLSFYILNIKSKTALGRIHFLVEKAVGAVSLNKRPFGGMEIKKDLSLNLIAAFINFYENQLKEHGIKSITIKQSPFAYSQTSASKITNSYLRAGYQITHPDLNHYIPIDKQPLEKKIHPMEKRKLRKAQENGFIFYEESPKNLEHIYALVHSCRKEKGQALNITLENLRQAMEGLPDTYKIFGTKAGTETIAVSIVVIVNNRIVYNFLPASLSTYNKWSPMVFLLAHIYDWAKSKKFEIFDLGISAVDNAPQHSLMQFKEHMGGKAGLKCTFGKELKHHDLNED